MPPPITEMSPAPTHYDVLQAANVLSDPLHRLLYDLDIGVVADTEDSQARVHRLKRKDAQRAVATMEETVAAMRAGEEAKQGLLILSARWGDLSVSEEDASLAVSAPYIDVTVPLQYLVSDSTLIFPGGQSHSWLEGFYDPSLGTNSAANRLHVRYKFLNMMHEATFGEDEEVCIPMEEHVMADEAAEAETAAAAPSPSSAAAASSSSTKSFASFSKRASTAAFASRSASASKVAPIQGVSATSRATLLAQAKARRRMVMYATLLAAGLGLYTIRSRGITFQSARLSAAHFAQWIKQMLGLGQTPLAIQAASGVTVATPPTYIAPPAPVAAAAAAPVDAAAL